MFAKADAGTLPVTARLVVPGAKLSAEGELRKSTEGRIEPRLELRPDRLRHHLQLFRNQLPRAVRCERLHGGPCRECEPAVVEEAMQSLQDSTIVLDTVFRPEAEEYLVKYLDYFKGELTLDQMMATLSALKWLGPKTEFARTKVGEVYKWAAESGYRVVADSAFSALESFGAKPQKLKIAVRPNPIDWNMLENGPDTLLIQSGIEMMFLKLHKYEAPLTCLNMLKLAEMNFFGTNYFHRVVPNFVIQGGDPTGTGSGGPGYSIRREISPLVYRKPAVVGMASSGKDTEGSQWFATHLPTPHLDTRYTIWGEIMNGLSAVEKFRRNDRVDNIIPFSMGE